MRISTLRPLMVVLFAIVFFSANAQTAMPVITNYQFSDGELMSRMSDNGKWAVASGTDADNTLIPINPKLINLETGEVTDLKAGCTDYFSASAVDVSDDGSIVVGSYNMMPAYWSASTKKWTLLPVGKGWAAGGVAAVSADGRYAVGTQDNEEDFFYEALLWDLTTGEIVETPGLPTKDMAHANMNMMMFHGISSDGRYILGSMSRSYLPAGDDAGGCCYFVYDRQNSSYNMIGFKESDTKDWTPLAEGLFLIDDAYMGANGKYVTGIAAAYKDVEGSEWGMEYRVPFLYDVENASFKMYNETDDMDFAGFTVGNEGTILASTPPASVARDWSIRHGNYWFSLSKVLKQKYGYDFVARTGMTITGTAIGVSNDGKRVLVMADPNAAYVLDLPDAVNTICDGVNLMSEYTIKPAQGAVISAVKSMYVTFDRDIYINSAVNAKAVELLDADGKVIANSVGFQVDNNSSRQAYIRFRNGSLEEGKKYKVHIPAGTIAMASDRSQVNEDIYVEYTGRANKPVEMTKVYPADGSTFAKIDYDSNPIIMTFDVPIALSDSAKAYLYRNGEPEPFCNLVMATKDNNLALYPATLQYLYSGSTYMVVVKEGSVTDVAGNGANDSIAVNYNGSYVREITTDGNVLFKDDCNSGLTRFMLYDGDQNTPAATPAVWGFNSVLPWWVAKSNDSSSNYAAVSHSMYSPAGKSDDWMVIPQIYIPDPLCSLEFLSQSYLKSKTDVLKVYVWASNEVYSSMNATLAETIRKEGTLVYDKVQSPGENEESLEDEWAENKVSLADFSGKNVYIAFVNENEDQSAIFVDDVQVLHNQLYRLALDNEENVVSQDDCVIKGRVAIDSDEKTYTSAKFTLIDGNGSEVDKIEADGLALKKDDVYEFAFSNPLPLTLGEANKYRVQANLDGDFNEATGNINDLAFKPVKRVVLEEFTGNTCGNCPLGIVAIERMKSVYGDLFIPMALHTFSSDILGTGLTGYSSYLGFSSAPSGRVDRMDITYPGVTNSDNTHVLFSTKNVNGNMTWQDCVDEQLNSGTIASIDISSNYNDDDKSVEIPCTVRYALNSETQNVNLLLVLVEDQVQGIMQENYFYNYGYPEMPDWCLGGKYGSSKVFKYVYDDVVRGVMGFNYNGTGGYIPQQVEYDTPYTNTFTFTLPEVINNVNNAKVVVMMIDANTDKVINTACTWIVEKSGVSNVDSDALSVKATAEGVEVSAQEAAKVFIMSIDGRVIANAEGEGNFVVSANGYNGVAIVNAVSANHRLVKKLIIK